MIKKTNLMDLQMTIQNLDYCLQEIPKGKANVKNNEGELTTLNSTIIAEYNNLEKHITKVKEALNSLREGVKLGDTFSDSTFKNYYNNNSNIFTSGNFGTAVFGNTESSKIIQTMQQEADIKNLLKDPALYALVTSISSGSGVPAGTTDETWAKYAKYYIREKEIATGRPIPEKTAEEMNALTKWLKDTNGGKVSTNSTSSGLKNKIDSIISDTNMRHMIEDVTPKINNSYTGTNVYSDKEWTNYAEYYIYDKAYRTGTTPEQLCGLAKGEAIPDTVWEQKVASVANWLKKDYGNN